MNDCGNCANALYRNGAGGPCKGCVEFSKWEAPQTPIEPAHCARCGNYLNEHGKSMSDCSRTGCEFRPTPIERALAAQVGGPTQPALCAVLAFLNDLCHPEQFGHAVTGEVRRRARELATALEAEEGIK